MPQQVSTAVENNFTKGYLTQYTGLNFPENAATDLDNCWLSLTGGISRREGMNFEENFALTELEVTGKAINSYKWNNVGGDGSTQIVVVQVGAQLHFYKSSDATASSPLSTKKLVSVLQIGSFLVADSSEDPSVTECQFTDGNGFLFVFHPNCEPFYCTYDNGSVIGTTIALQIRDVTGITETNVADNFRPSTLSRVHEYNLNNQGWTSGNPWQVRSTSSVLVATGARSWNIGLGVPVSVGQHVIANWTGSYTGQNTMSGTVSGYSGGIITIAINSVDNQIQNNIYSSWTLTPLTNGYINSWFSAIGNYPSNSDVWWRFKDSTNVFNPASTFANITINTAPAPKGKIILNAFNQDRSLSSALPDLTPVKTTKRPSTGIWFQGRIWYAGIDASQQATGNAQYYTWTENIYFSQTVQTQVEFGKCYKENDPTSEDLFDDLPTDGGVITIQGCGSIYKLFPIQNGLLVFAANGIWFITGSRGIGFAANDYTITNISYIQSISGTSFVNVQGLPYFWNEEGIYCVTPSPNNGLQVQPITVDTILRYYESIPLQSKKFARAAYDPVEYVIQWIYRDENETDVTSRYQFNKILNYNVYNKAFSPYTLVGTPYVHAINYVVSPGGSTAPEPAVKYFCSYPSTISLNQTTFSSLYDDRFVDFFDYDDAGTDYTSYFVTGYKIRGQAIRKYQPQYVQLWTAMYGKPAAYKIQGIWDYANDRNSNRWSTQQVANLGVTRFDVLPKRHKIRGHGYALQYKITSVSGMPFDIIGWAVVDTTNAGT